jgi:hypothetical protein
VQFKFVPFIFEQMDQAAIFGDGDPDNLSAASSVSASGGAMLTGVGKASSAGTSEDSWAQSRQQLMISKKFDLEVCLL